MNQAFKRKCDQILKDNPISIDYKDNWFTSSESEDDAPKIKRVKLNPKSDTIEADIIARPSKPSMIRGYMRLSDVDFHREVSINKEITEQCQFMQSLQGSLRQSEIIQCKKTITSQEEVIDTLQGMLKSAHKTIRSLKEKLVHSVANVIDYESDKKEKENDTKAQDQFNDVMYMLANQDKFGERQIDFLLDIFAPNDAEYEQSRMMLRYLANKEKLDEKDVFSLNSLQKEELEHGILSMEKGYIEPLIDLLQPIIPGVAILDEDGAFELDVDSIGNALQVKMYNCMLDAIYAQVEKKTKRKMQNK